MKKMQIIDTKTGKVENEKEFHGDFIFQYVGTEDGRIHQVGRIHNARFGEKHEIKNWYYAPIAQKLAKKFDELSHIRAGSILFLENIRWEPSASESKKRTWIARVKKATEWLENTWRYEYIIEIKNHFSERMSKEQIVALLYHELRHIGPDGDIYPHDVEDWGNMVATFGTEWATASAYIVNLLDNEFPGWDNLRSNGRQLSLFPSTASAALNTTK